MSDEAHRLSRIKSLINRDMQSVHGRAAPVHPSPQQAADSALRQRKEQLETQDLAIREKTQQRRQQRQQQHRQHILAETARKTALYEQKQKQEALRLQKEHAERQKIQQQMRTTVPSPQEMGEVEKSSEGKVLELTKLARQGPSPQQRAALSRKDARLYSPFAHTNPRAASQRSFVRSMGAGVFAFLLDPFLLLWRTILWPYRILRSVSRTTYRSSTYRSPVRRGRQGFADTTTKALLSCWHFATAPLHLLAHAVIDPLGMFTRQPHNYPRLSSSIYARIFAQQTQRNFLILLRGVGHLARTLGRFVAAPLLLLASVVLVPWRSLRYGIVRHAASTVAEGSAGFWRRARIRSVGFVQILQSRAFALFRLQREKSQRTASSISFLVGSILRRGWRGLPFLSRTSKGIGKDIGKGIEQRLGRNLATLPKTFLAKTFLAKTFLAKTFLAPLLRRRKQARKPFFDRHEGVARNTSDSRATPVGKGSRHEQDAKASKHEEKPLSTTDKTGLFASSEHSLLEDFFASEEKAEQGDKLAEGDGGDDKEAVYRDMDDLRSALEGDTKLSDVPRAAASSEEKIFQEVEGLDEQTRAKLLQRLGRRVETEKLR